MFSGNNERAFTRAALHVTRPVNEKPHFLTLQIASSSARACAFSPRLSLNPAFVHSDLRRRSRIFQRVGGGRLALTHVLARRLTREVNELFRARLTEASRRIEVAERDYSRA